MSDTLTIIKPTASELSLTLATTINEMHSECMTVDNQLTMIVLQKINLVRECGIMLIEAKAQATHGQWLPWIKDNLTMSEDTAQLYMRFAKANAEPVRYLADGIKTVKDAMVAVGLMMVRVSLITGCLCWFCRFLLHSLVCCWCSWEVQVCVSSPADFCSARLASRRADWPAPSCSGPR